MDNTEGKVVDTLVLEMSCAEVALPAHMMYLMGCAVVADKYVLRADFVENLNRATAVALMPLQDRLGSIERVAKRVDTTAIRLLNLLNPQDNVNGFYATCMFPVLLVQEDLLADVKAMAVLSGLALLSELKNEGGPDGYAIRETLLTNDARRMLDEARREGLYRMHITKPNLLSV